MEKYINILKGDHKRFENMVKEIIKDENTYLFENDDFIKSIFDNILDSYSDFRDFYNTGIKLSANSETIKYIFDFKKINEIFFTIFDDKTQYNNFDLLLEIKKDEKLLFYFDTLSKDIRKNPKIMEKFLKNAYLINCKTIENIIIINNKNKNEMFNAIQKLDIALNSKLLKKLGVEKDIKNPNLIDLKQIATPFKENRDKVLENDYKTNRGYLTIEMENFFIKNHHYLDKNEFSKIIERYYDNLYSIAKLIKENLSIKERFENDKTGYSFVALQKEFEKYNIKIA